MAGRAGAPRGRSRTRFAWILASLALLLGACGRAPGTRARSSGGDQQVGKSFDEFQKRTIHKILTAEVLASIPDDKLEQAIVDFIYAKFEAPGADERKVLQGLSEGFRIIHSTWVVEAEVNNGGLNQFFWNSSGQYAGDAVAGFTRLGAPDLADLMRRAIAIHQQEAGRLAAFKARGTTEAFNESYEGNRLNALDDTFYTASEKLGALRVRYIRENTPLFVAE